MYIYEFNITPQSRVLAKLIGANLLEKFPTIYGTQRCVHKSLSLIPILSQIGPAHTLLSLRSTLLYTIYD
jgi:hypothetical protein